MADASAKRVEIVMRYSTVVTVYALLSATPAFAAGGGAIAWDRETGKYGASWNQPTPKQAVEAAISQCGASGCKVALKVRPMMCGALAISGDRKRPVPLCGKISIPPVLPPSHLVRRIREPLTAPLRRLIAISEATQLKAAQLAGHAMDCQISRNMLGEQRLVGRIPPGLWLKCVNRWPFSGSWEKIAVDRHATYGIVDLDREEFYGEARATAAADDRAS